MPIVKPASFSMCLSTLRKEHRDHILNVGRLRLCGTTSIQVPIKILMLRLVKTVGEYTQFLILIVCVWLKDSEFGRLQARDMLQHLWTGPISNSSVDVVQGSRSVEVRAVGVTKVGNKSWLLLITFTSYMCLANNNNKQNMIKTRF